MFKRIFLTVALTMALAVPAFAQNSGFYLGLKFIDSIQSTGNVSTSKGASFFDTGDYSQNTVGGGAFVGYDFYPANDIPLRAEIEYAIRTNSETDWDAKHGLDATLKGRWNLQTLFLNVYWDFHNDTAFTPYIGGGLGMGFIESRYKVEGQGYSGSSTDYNTVFAWNAGAGVSYAFTETISADLAYRFVGLGYYEHEKSFAGQKAKVGMAPYANEFSLGVRFTF